MVLSTILHRSFIKISSKLLTVAALIISSNTFGQNSDSTKRLVLAAAPLKIESTYMLRAANVVFPEILKGTEVVAKNYVSTYSTDKRGWLLAMHEKGKTIIPKLNTIFKKYDLPQELSVLMVLESAFNGNAVSKCGAVGYWQIMDVVAKQYGMKYLQKRSRAVTKMLAKSKYNNSYLLRKQLGKDDRKNFNKSTITAARFFRDSRKVFDDNWLLIVASYNCGMGNVRKAISKSHKTDPDFWDIKKFLPSETQAYVMNFIALNVIYNNYDNFISNNLNFIPVKLLIPYNYQQNNSEQLNSPLEN